MATFFPRFQSLRHDPIIIVATHLPPPHKTHQPKPSKMVTTLRSRPFHHLGLASRIVAVLNEDAHTQQKMSWTRLLFARECTFSSGYSAFVPKSLNSILKVESIKNATPEELTNIWNEHHIGRGCISAVMGREQFGTLQHRAKVCPMFVIPLRREKGYVSMFLQAQMPYMLFTSLEDYKAKGTKASPYFTITHYNELADSKGLILVRGDIVFTSKLNDEEAKSLLETAHSFYLSDSRHTLVQQFNKQSGEFEFKDVLRELQLPSGS